MKLTKTAPSPPPPDPVRVALAQAIAAKAEAERKVSDAKKLIEARIDVWLDLVHKAEQARAALDDRGVDARERDEALAPLADAVSRTRPNVDFARG